MSAATLLKHADLPQLHVTWSGATVASSDAARNRIVAAAVKPALTWKRPQSLPLPVSFAVQIVDEKSAVEAATRQDGQTLLHIFCVDSASVDAYRKGARLAAAEWFASKTAAPSVSWLLLFDSTAARTAKQRPAVLDALKKDFAKVHQSKLIEFWTTADGPAQQAFDVAIRNALLAGLQARYEQLEADLSSVRFVESDSREETVSWRGDLYVDRHWMLARLLWAAGAVEEAVRELHRSDEHVNSVSGLSGHENDLAAAPLLRTLLASRRAPAVSAVLPLRLFLLSKRLLATVALHQKRASTPSARKDHAQLAVRATHDLLKSLDEKLPAVEGSALVRRSAWRHCVAVDAWSLTTRALAEPTDGEEAALVAGHLHSIQANELLTVWHLLSDMGAKSGEDEKLALWLEAGESQRKPQQQDGVEIDAAEKLVVAIREGRQKLGQLTAERLEVAERTLRRLGWKRDAVDLAVERARILGSPGMWRTFARRAALLLLEQKDDEKQAATALLEMRENLPQELESTLAHRLVLCSYRQIPEQRRIEAAKDLLAMLDKAENEGKSAHLNAELFVKTAPDDETELYERATKAVAVGIHERDMVRVERGEKLTIHVYSRNDLSVSLKNCRITVTVKSARSATEEASVEPLTFTTVYQPVERVARVVCTNRNESEREASPQQQQQQQTKSVDDSDADKRQKQALREMTLEKIEVPPGASTVFALSTGTAGWAPGLYVVDSVELRSSALVVRGNARTERGGRSHVILIGRPAHRMEVVVPRNRNDESERDEEEQELWAGVPQRLEVRLSAGRARPTTAAVVAIQAAAAEEEYSKDSEEDRSSSSRPTVLLAATRNGGGWAQKLLIPAKGIAPGQIERLEFYVFRPVVSAEKTTIWLTLSWCDVTRKTSLTLKPLFRVRADSSVLEDSVLVELEVSRLGQTFPVRIRPKRVALLCGHNEAKLLNPDLPDIRADEETRLVWQLGSELLPATAARMEMFYEVLGNEEEDDDRPLGGCEWRYDADLQLAAMVPDLELCAQVLPTHPGTQLCRVDTICHLVVSLRTMRSTERRRLQLTLDADPELWSLHDREKVVTLKDSGLAQVSFTVQPRVAGFLPYPTVQVFRLKTGRGREEEDNDDEIPDGFAEEEGEDEEHNEHAGVRLCCYVRTAGKQARILAAAGLCESPSSDHLSRSSNSTTGGGGRASVLKQKVLKIFD